MLSSRNRKNSRWPQNLNLIPPCQVGNLIESLESRPLDHLAPCGLNSSYPSLRQIKIKNIVGPYKSTYFAALCFATAIDEQGPPPLMDRGSCVNRGNIAAIVYSLFLYVAAKHDSRDIKINLKLILGFWDRCCHVSRLPGNTILSL